jgi:HD-like signal output (HDOD) protein/CheY-like chemotaxis protein
MADKIEKTVLFVDDDPPVLSSLRRLLRKEPWHLLFANCAKEGLDLLTEHPVDLVVSDMRMPEMDGAGFLRKIKDLYPHTIRVILTGYADRDVVASMLQNECAHQMITKPWEPNELRSVLSKLLTTNDSLQNTMPLLGSKVIEVDNLPTLTQSYLKIKEILAQSSNLSIKQIGQEIEQDPSISVRLLKWANSALFGQRNRVDTIQRAVVVLGMEMVQGLVLSMSVFDMLQPDTPPPAGYSREGFWKHSLASGLASRWIGKKTGLEQVISDKLFTAGLLHDLGKMFEDCYLHEDFVQAVELAQAEHITLRDAEKKVMQMTHMETGAYLSEWWDLSPVVTDVIRWHHSPGMSVQEDQVVDVVHIANACVQQFGIGLSGNFARIHIEPRILNKVGMGSQDLLELKAYLMQIGS